MAKNIINQAQAQGTTLGYAQSATTFSSASTTPVQIPGLSTTVTVPAGGRRVKISVSSWAVSSATAAYVNISIWDGAVGTGTDIYESETYVQFQNPCFFSATTVPTAGSHTYNIGFKTTSGTPNFNAKAAAPAFVLVELL